MSVRKTLFVLIAPVLVAGCNGADSGAVDTEALASRRAACVGCHGKTGIAQAPNFPTIAGQPVGYLVRTMTAYRDGQRKNAIMNGQMQGFSDAEIQALAIYYHQQSSPLARHVDTRETPGNDNKGVSQ